MSFKDEIFYANAKNHEVAGVAIKVSRINSALIMALIKIQQGEKPDAEIKMLNEISLELDAIFNRLSGYVPDE